MSARVGTSDELRTTHNDAYSRRFWRASKPETHNDALPRQAAHCYNKNYRDFLHRVAFYVDSNFLEKHDAYNFRVEGSGVTICSGYRPIATITWTLVAQNYGNGKGVCRRRRQKFCWKSCVSAYKIKFHKNLEYHNQKSHNYENPRSHNKNVL